jgi:23S rRNA (cytidine1920-2'-O)/16S rRNA (cytidine1409-2'-O)-methyltransferase
MAVKVRADVLLFERSLAESRERARALILAGKVYTGERRIDKAGERLLDDAPLSVRGDLHPYVSRGGLKLEGALLSFDFDPRDRVAADIGASTGGFTDCLLQRGATKVYAIDVGYGQLHNKLRSDPRVVVMERTNARHLGPDSLPERPDLVVVDASFIGLEKLLPAIVAILAPEGDVLALVKPQFEVGRDRVQAGGVVRDEAIRQDAIDQVARAAASLGLVERSRADAAIKGPKGNHEAFLWLTRTGPNMDAEADRS